MKFSIDSNIIIAVVLPTHRLHATSIKHIKDRHDYGFVLSSTALKESATTFRNRLNHTISEKIMPILPPLLDNTKSKIERDAYLIKSFRQLKQDNPSISDFLDLIYNDIAKFVAENDGAQLPSFLSKLSYKHSQLLYQKLERVYPHDIQLISLNHEHRADAQKITADVYFKDAHDKMILEDLMTNLPKIVPLEFLTGDKEFTKKIGKVYGKCLHFYGLDESCFACIFVA
nr:hypothetical protein [uncultured Methanolobus sp.]